MKKTLFLLIALACSAVLSVSAQQQTAFPGAEGFGRYALGARGVSNPTVYHVTNLNDSGTGSLRDAVSKPGRIVVFDVAGVIHLKSRLIFSANSYVAGQSAPGDGVIVYGDGVSFSGANNLIVRYMRFYMGKEGSSGKDASGISNGSDMLFDHLSILWGLDENFSVNWDGKGTEPGNITIQHSIIGQGIMSHSAGGLIQTNNGVSIIGNLYIDNKTRNPKVKGLNQFVNNVVYNWDGSNGYILGDTEASSWAHLEGNYFICGPQSRSPFTRATKSFQIYHKGDFIDKDKDGTLNGYEAQDADYGGLTFQPDLNSFTGIPKPHPTFPILTAAQALDEVIASAGASLPARSAPDAYLIDQLRSYGTKGALILNESANGIYQNVGVVSEGKKAADADNDGMPDAWETAAGLNPNDAADAVAMASNGYLNIENYLAGIQAPQMPYVRCASYLKMDARTRNSIQLSWQNNAVESDAIELQQSTDGINYTSTTLAANATSHNVTGLAEETTYYFRLVTKKTGIEDSTPSEVLKASTQGTPKAPYACLNPSPGVGETTRFYTQVPFAWENETGTWGGEVTYTLYVGTSEGSLTQVAGGLTQTSYTYSAALTMETTYYWRVDATNTLGTTPGTVWNFKAGTSSFTASYIDIGTDYDGTPGSRITAQSGIKFSSAKEYTLAEGTSTEMKVKVSTGSTAMNNSNNNVYDTKGKLYAAYPNTAFTHYVEDALTQNSAAQSIASVTINGTSSELDKGYTVALLFSDHYPFDTQSVIGFDEVELAPCRSGEAAKTSQAPVGTKSFRIYKKTALAAIDDDRYKVETAESSTTIAVGGGGGSPRIAYIGATLEEVSDDAPTTGLQQTPGAVAPRLSYRDGVLYNPDGLAVAVYSTGGTCLMRSSQTTIALGTLPAGIYIAKAAGQVLKFAR